MTAPAGPRAWTDLISTADVSRDEVESVFELADWVSGAPRRELRNLLQGKALGVLFYQNSTRTRLSFEAAMQRLGGAVLGFDDVRTTRAGDFFQESLADTVGVIGQYVDGLVIRHPDDDAGRLAAASSPVPVINGGDGANEHPTQALLDAWTMCRAIGTLDGARIGLVGDPACRDFRSLIQLLPTLGVSELLSLSVPGTGLTDELRAKLDERGVAWRSVTHADELLDHADAVSMLPVELPSFHLATADPEDRPAMDDRFRVTRSKLLRAARRVPVLHVGPRGQELPPEVDDLEGVYYRDHARAGVYLRAALLMTLLG